MIRYLQDPLRGPRGDGIRDDERTEHRGRHHEADREEVLFRHPGERRNQRVENEHHGEGREDRRVADFRDRAGGECRPVRGGIRRVMPVDILDHHDRVIDEKPERDHKAEKRHPVDRESRRFVDKERKRQNERDRDPGDAGRAEPEEYPGDREDRGDRHRDMTDHGVHGFVCLRAVVTRDDEVNVFREELRLHPVDASEHRFGRDDSVCALFLRRHKGDRRGFARGGLREFRRRPRGPAAECGAFG